MLAFFLTLLISYCVISLFGYVMHWVLHQSWMGSINQAHMTHHQKLYPPDDYVSDYYRRAGKDAAPKFFIIAALPLIIAPLVLCILGILPWYLLLTIWLMEALMGFLHDYLHDAFHIKNHWLNHLPVVRDIFRRWNYLHYLHHVDMGANYGIFSFHWDRLFKTYCYKK